MEFSKRILKDNPPSVPKDIHIDPLTNASIESGDTPTTKTKLKYLRRKQKVLPTSVKEQFSCLECDAKFSGKLDLRKHSKVHMVIRFECETCGKSFNRQTNLNVHLRSHTKQKLFSCPNCNQRYAKKQNVDIHLNSGKCTKRPFACTVCSRSFELEIQLNTHMKSHNRKDETPLKLVSTSTTKRNLYPNAILPRDYQRGRYICNQCFQDYTTKANLDSHVRTQHEGDKPFECAECGRKFSLKTRLNFHRKVHTGDKPHLCSNCGKSFRLKAHLIVHERSHTGETPFKCLACDKTFYQRAHLISHMMQHTGDTPFSCSHCEKAYTRAHTLKNHIAKCHPSAPKTEPLEAD